MGFSSQAFLVFLVTESKKRRRKQLGKLMAKSCSQPVSLVSARPLMNPLPYYLISSLLSVSGRLREVKNKRKFQTFSPKSCCGRLQEVVAYMKFPV